MGTGNEPSCIAIYATSGEASEASGSFHLLLLAKTWGKVGGGCSYDV